MDNPFVMAMQMARNGRNPMQVFQSMAMQNPQMAQAMRMINGKSSQQLRTVAENMAKERGIDLEQMAHSLCLQLPK